MEEKKIVRMKLEPVNEELENRLKNGIGNLNFTISKVIPPDLDKRDEEIMENKRVIDEFYDNLSNDTPLVSSWEQLQKIKSDTHELEVDLYYGNAWIRNKETDQDHYLSTHTFYESQYKWSTKLLNDCGYKVKLESWG